MKLYVSGNETTDQCMIVYCHCAPLLLFDSYTPPVHLQGSSSSTRAATTSQPPPGGARRRATRPPSPISRLYAGGNYPKGMEMPYTVIPEDSIVP